ncbi:hypothetical protein [Streptomyces enissocaesilis]|uniref:Integral membrane protein n=1 Tax=Streptomyces enissocaesilis TaxID=332589 RepID=A0ABN3XMJ3_9ACTN
MSDVERKGNQAVPEPPGRGAQWRRRAQRARREVGLYVVRGAATAVGGAVVTYGFLWAQTRL